MIKGEGGKWTKGENGGQNFKDKIWKPVQFDRTWWIVGINTGTAGTGDCLRLRLWLQKPREIGKDKVLNKKLKK